MNVCVWGGEPLLWEGEEVDAGRMSLVVLRSQPQTVRHASFCFPIYILLFLFCISFIYENTIKRGLIFYTNLVSCCLFCPCLVFQQNSSVLWEDEPVWPALQPVGEVLWYGAASAVVELQSFNNPLTFTRQRGENALNWWVLIALK